MITIYDSQQLEINNIFMSLPLIDLVHSVKFFFNQHFSSITLLRECLFQILK